MNRLKLLLVMSLVGLVVASCTGEAGNDDKKWNAEPVIGGEACPPPQDFMPTAPDDDDAGFEDDSNACEASGQESFAHSRPVCDRYVVLDGKMWAVCSSDIEVTFECAFFEAETTHFCDRAGWRLPTIDELRSLYDPTNAKKLRWCIDPTESEVYIRDPFCLMERSIWALDGDGYASFRFFEGTVDDHNPSRVCAALYVRP